jgi:competence protein ComEA
MYFVSEKNAILEDRLFVMIWIKRWVKEFFGLSHSQANGFIILIPLLAIILFSEPLWRWYVGRQEYDFSMDQAKLDSLIGVWEKNRSVHRGETDKAAISRTGLFLFNPNHVAEEQLQELGFSSSLARRIANYRHKGGKFKVKSDLLKIYGVDSSFYQSLYAFIDLPEKTESKKKYPEFKKDEYKIKNPSEGRFVSIDLNLADTSHFKKVKGIGEKLSLRMIKYREALGGFVSVEQVAEIYGLDSVVVSLLAKASYVKKDFKPLKININTADERTLAIHPYLSKEAARSIVAYRFQHGRFATLDDLRKIHAMDDKTIQKIAPYLTVDDQ